MAGEYAILNPGSRRRHRRRRRKSTPRAARRHTRRRRRRNPYLMNPPRRRRARRSGRRHYARRRRRNPGLAGVGGGPKFFGLDIGAAAMIAGGAIGSEIATGFIANQAFVPDQMKSGPGRFALKAAVGLGAPMLLRRFIGPRVSNLLVLGAGVGLMVDAYRTWVAPNIPGLSDFDELSGYSATGTQYALGAGEGAEDIDGFGGIEDSASFDE